MHTHTYVHTKTQQIVKKVRTYILPHTNHSLLDCHCVKVFQLINQQMCTGSVCSQLVHIPTYTRRKHCTSTLSDFFHLSMTINHPCNYQCTCHLHKHTTNHHTYIHTCTHTHSTSAYRWLHTLNEIQVQLIQLAEACLHNALHLNILCPLHTYICNKKELKARNDFLYYYFITIILIYQY